MTGADGYTTDIVYPSAYGAFQAPVHLAYAAAVGGRASVELSAPFTYCDLGCGTGLTLCVLADCYPQAQFYGVDLNPAHIAEARRMADAAGLKNIVLHQAHFGDLSSLALPRLDFVAMSGIYSWLPARVRRDVLAWTAGRLTPAGHLFVHYAALPGNSQIDALYALIREVARGLDGDSLIRFTAAIEMLQRLSAAKARFFEVNPYAAAWLAGLHRHDQNSMAHEVLNAQSSSLSARDMAEEAEPHGLSFVGNAQLELNDIAISAPAVLREDLSRASRIAREMMIDAWRNAHSRMDVYGPDAKSEFFSKSVGAVIVDRLTRGPLTAERAELTSRSGAVLQGDVYDAILGSADGRAIAIANLTSELTARGFSRPSVEAALQRLIALKLLHILRRPYAHERPSARPRLRSNLNRLLLDEAIQTGGPVPLGSPVAGTQILMPPPDRLALLALLDGDFASAWRRISASGQRIRFEGKLVIDAAGLRAAADHRARAIGGEMLEQLARMEIIA